MFYKILIWGLIGMCVVLMFGLFSGGVTSAINNGLLYRTSGFSGRLLQAFFTSMLMNLTFGPVLMAVTGLQTLGSICVP